VRPLETTLKQNLKDAGRVAILGIGSDLRGDDVAGILTAQQIEKIIGRKKTITQARVFIGATAPENLTGEIKRFQPTHLIIIDAAEMNATPGHIEILNPDTISGATFCTHSLPVKVIIDYLLQSFKFEVITIGIQPKTLTVGATPSKEILAAVKQLSSILGKLLIKS